MIGSLSHLIRGAAIEAILDGSEQITRKLLDTIDIDHAAESAARGAAKPVTATPSPTASSRAPCRSVPGRGQGRPQPPISAGWPGPTTCGPHTSPLPPRSRPARTDPARLARGPGGPASDLTGTRLHRGPARATARARTAGRNSKADLFATIRQDADQTAGPSAHWPTNTASTGASPPGARITRPRPAQEPPTGRTQAGPVQGHDQRLSPAGNSQP